MQPGSTVGPYRIERHLGDGGMGSVWLAEDTRLHRRVALKTLRTATMDGAGRERLMREARAAAALNHPHIAAVYDVIDAGGSVAIVFEHVEGMTLATRLADGRMPVDRVLQIGIQLAKALVAAHQQGVIHRDLKPANVIVGSDGDIKVLDFGIARLLPAGTTAPATHETVSAGFIGTPAYAAPEQMFTAAVDERADLYALGVMLFELTTGRRPFAGGDLAAMASAKLTQKAPTLTSAGALVPRALDTLVGRLLAQQPDDRPASAAEVLGALKAIAGDPTTEALPAPRRRPWRWAAAMTVLSLIVGALLFVLNGPGLTTVSASQPVVAVMPLRNMSGDPAKDYLAAGLSESLIAGLASSPSLTVLSRSAVAEAVKVDGATAAAVKELGATHVIDGSIQHSGTQLRVAINLIRPDQSIAWARTFDGSVDRVFDLQTRMALAVSEAMSAGRPAAAPAMPDNQAALDAYWRGRALLDRWDVQGNIDAAILALEESVKTDPGFALAHAGLGLAYWQKYSEEKDQQFARLAIESGSKAAALDPNLPEVHFALAVSLAGTGRTDEAARELEAALALRPTFDDARRKLGDVLAARGNIDDAVAEYNRAIALRPRFWGGYSQLGLALFNAARYADAARAFEQVVALQPDNQMGFQQLGSSYQMLGDAAKALAAYEKALSIRESYGAYSNIGMLHHIQGNFPKAVDAYARAVALRPNVAAAHRNLGDAYARMGKPAEAQRAYEQAVARAEAELAVNPKSARSLAALAVYLIKAKRPRDAEARIQSALTIAPDDLTVRYRAAVVNSLKGDRDRALQHIGELIKRGYSVSAVREEEDFASLRGTSRFQELVHTP